ncbi:EMILIN-1-like isoform X4 [Synchiropus splendidus]|uniref:EMILIN-1-like isoform X4 n=1 Tax=Synchiropus splendidus TaxID=270530 RepID=UPI00237E0E3F|nr:EMILIN-1-like isoform X4 [Synchiropus splendidus]
MTTLKSALGSARKQREQIGVPLCRMSSSVLLLLLSALVSRALADCWDPQDAGGVRTRRENLKSEVPSDAALFWDELRGLKQMVLSLKAAEVGQRQILRRTEARLRDRELEGEQLKQSLERVRLRVESDGRQLQEQLRALREADLQALESRLNASERAAGDLKQRSAALAEALPFLQTRLRASEVTVVELQRKNTGFYLLLASTSATPPPPSSPRCRSRCGLATLRRRARPGAAEEAELPTPPSSLQLLLRLGARPGAADLQRGRCVGPCGGACFGRVTCLCAGVESRLRSTQAQVERLQSAASNVSSGLEARLDWARSSILELQVGVTSAQTGLQRLQNRTQATQLEPGLAARLDRISSSLRGVELRQGASQQQLQRLQEGSAAQEAELRRLRARLNVSEERLQRQETWSSGAEVRLRSSQERVEHLQTLASEVTNRSLTEASQLESRVGAGLDQIFSRLQGAEVQLRATEEHLSSGSPHHPDRKSGPSLTSAFLLDVVPRLKRAEELLETVKRSSSVQEVAVQRLRWRLNVSQEHLQQLETRSSAQGSSLDSLALTLNTTGGRLHQPETWNSELSRRLTAAEEQLDRRRAQTAGALRVAFSAGLADAGAVGPFDEETTLVFSKSVTNEGGAYDPTTGVFTSPLRGLYFFSFTAADFIKGYMGLNLYHNQQPVLFSLQLNDHGGYASTCGSVTLLLEERDRVRLSLPATYRLYDDSRNFSFFSGFLLFPL